MKKIGVQGLIMVPEMIKMDMSLCFTEQFSSQSRFLFGIQPLVQVPEKHGCWYLQMREVKMMGADIV